MLTAQQKQAFDLIERSVREAGIAPSIAEIADGLGLKSKAGAMRIVHALEERGFIRRIPHRARAIEVLRRPDSPPVSWILEKRNLLSIIMRQNDRLTALGQAPEEVPDAP